VPERYEERLTEMYRGAFAHLRLVALDPNDIALSKLERNTQRDRGDIRHLARVIPFDLAAPRERYHARGSNATTVDRSHPGGKKPGTEVNRPTQGGTRPSGPNAASYTDI
jgi:hypothetical protein